MYKGPTKSNVGRLRWYCTGPLLFLLVGHLVFVAIAFRLHAEGNWGAKTVQASWDPGSWPVLWVLLPPPLLLILTGILWRTHLLHFFAVCSTALFLFLAAHWVAGYFGMVSYGMARHHAISGRERIAGVWTVWQAGGIWMRFENAGLDSADNLTVPLRLDFGCGKPFDAGYPELPNHGAGTYWESPGWCSNLGVSWMYANAWPGSATSYCNRFFLIVPVWLPMILCVPLPLLSLRRIRRNRAALRAHARLCRTCSYNLHAHEPGQKCPECGTPMEA